MSIIYDALQKTQKNREDEVKLVTPSSSAIFMPRERKRNWWPLIGMTLLILTFSFYVYPLLPHSSHRQEQKTAKVSHLPAIPIETTTNTLVLNGIFVSDYHKAAMINHKIYPLGATVNNMTITAISAKSVTLSNGEHVVKLYPVV